MFNYLKVYVFLIISAGLLMACGDSDAPEGESTATSSEIVYLPSQVVYQEEIYKNWPYTEAPSVTKVVEETVSTPEPAVVEEAPELVVNTNAKTHAINAKGRAFAPDTIYINPGDTVAWKNMSSHNSVSVEGLIPEGATPWTSKMGENLNITLNVEGVYAYVCVPHIGFGMVGLIIVGKPSNLEEVKAFAKDNLKGPFRRLIGKINKVKMP